jgi:hypothetical protein
LYPAIPEDELALQLNAAECTVPLTPVPAVVTEFGELVALLVMVTRPVTLPVALGANTTLICAVCPAAMVVPVTPLMTLKPVPVTAICDTVTLEFPVFFTPTPSVLVPPTVSFPKFRFDVDNESVFVAEPPVPLSARVIVGFDALLLRVTLPITLPDAVGRNATVKLAVLAGASVNGMAKPVIWNPTPLTVALEIVKLDPPVFFNCTVCEFFTPVTTVPKAMLEGVADTVPGVAAVAVPVNEYCAVPFVALLV